MAHFFLLSQSACDAFQSALVGIEENDEEGLAAVEASGWLQQVREEEEERKICKKRGNEGPAEIN